MEHDRIAVIDFGGQYAHLIATKVRRLSVLAEIRQPEDPVEAFEGVSGIIISGSPALASFGDESDYTKAIFEMDIPIMGFCFGHQQIALYYGGKVEHTRNEFGFATLHVQGDSPIFRGTPAEQTVWMSHYDTVTELPEGFEEIGWTTVEGDEEIHRNAAIADHERRRFGFQFHPEVDDTQYGEHILRAFVLEVCGCRPTWTMERYIEEQVESIKRQAGERGVFLLVSGGVDSSVCAALLIEALPPGQLKLLHIDNGMMRKDESRLVIEELRRVGMGESLHFRDASDTFLAALDGLTDPEQKRRAIGETFIEVFEQEARSLGLEDMLLGQGTIYPDTVETGGTKRADTIKTHHNRVGIIQDMISEGRVVEPIAELYKVEVRELGEKLGLDPRIVWRHPFPGPGLGVRLLCSDGTPAPGHDPAAHQPTIDAIARPHGVAGVVLPLRSVGVKADLRAYEQPVMLWGDASFETVERVAARIYKEISGVNRCVWDLSGKGVTSAEPLEALATRSRFDLLRQADDIVMRALERHDMMRTVWQCPTVLVPLCLDGQGEELIVIRPVLSERAMTARPAELPRRLIDEIGPELLALPGVTGLALDVTTKPPGTIEWE
ncbi:MAG: glutamine-hydrolyzing GMP synthase [Deltaproteobacteria bacterium]|nr:glutamine-hydrolyzing GMP synthase [Deltaproteobacteria bacterium]